MSSPDRIAENIERIAELFPSVMTEVLGGGGSRSALLTSIC